MVQLGSAPALRVAPGLGGVIRMLPQASSLLVPVLGRYEANWPSAPLIRLALRVLRCANFRVLQQNGHFLRQGFG